MEPNRSILALEHSLNAKAPKAIPGAVAQNAGQRLDRRAARRGEAADSIQRGSGRAYLRGYRGARGKGRRVTISLEAEKSVLGGMLIDSRAAATAFAELQSRHFGLERHRHIFDALAHLREKGQPLDAVMTVEELERRGLLQICGGFTYITDLTIFTISSANIGQHIAILHRDYELRELEAASVTIARAVEDHDENALEIAEKAIFDIGQQRQRSELRPVGIDAHEAWSELLDTDGRQCTPTGYVDFDVLLNGGLRRRTLDIIAARPRVGKTAFAGNIALHAARQGKTVVFFSLEQSKSELIQRMIAAHGGVDLREVRQEAREVRADKPGSASERALKAADYIATLPLFITDRPALAYQDIRSELLRHRLRNPLDLVIVDHLQHVGFRAGARTRTSA